MNDGTNYTEIVVEYFKIMNPYFFLVKENYEHLTLSSVKNYEPLFFFSEGKL